jgi:hypothetical protein
MLTFRSSPAILTNSIFSRYRMAHTKLTPCKSTRPKGVPRRQLAPRDKGASSSSSRLDHQTKIERLSAELAQATWDRVNDAIQVGELQSQLWRLTGAHLSCERMMGRLVVERNEAWHQEDVARERVKVPSLVLANWWNLGLTFVSKWMI